MSAYLVEDSVIDYILSAWIRSSKYGLPSAYVSRPDIPGDFNRVGGDYAGIEWIGQQMVNENYASLAARYGDNDQPHKYRFREHLSAKLGDRAVVAAQAFKAIANLDYQSCEHKGWQASVAYQALNSIRNALPELLPAYENAEWGAPPHPQGEGGMVPSKLIRLV